MSAQPDPTPAPRRQRSARQLFCSTILALEAFVVGFAALVAVGLRMADGTTIAAVTVTGVCGCLLAAATLRSGVGYWLGSLMQIGLVASGVWLPAMYVVGGVFAIIWIVSLPLGARIDRERREREAAEAAG